ncbi:MAG: hypothetical protein NZ699_18270 [Roseiflexus sp.]|nr:hypothetical protein [Roseiflexus sp.]MCS7291071.1 hypothetical protein [Roseiflexus sp.]MDW8145801.1 hypothetical protein [Roseiflexaceae bacterium]MDW8232956.1 hypothetical protein [Roseiflexaceae bacterium]
MASSSLVPRICAVNQTQTRITARYATTVIGLTTPRLLLLFIAKP